jgi:CRISPR-associated protein Csb2
MFRLEPAEDAPRIWPTVAKTLRVAEMVRGAWCTAMDPEIPAILHGHEGRHLAIVPVAAVGHRHADGRIHGVAILVPRGLSAGDRVSLDHACARLESAKLYNRQGAWGLRKPAWDEELPRTLEARTWARPDRYWSSVTPVVLDRFPRRALGAVMVLSRSLATLALPEPTRMRVERFSAVPGVPLAWQFATQREGQPRRPAFHVTIEFPVPVAGPVLVGQLRHFGLGLLRPAGETARLFLDEGEQ